MGILVVASLSSLALGDAVDASIILVTVGVSGILEALQTHRAHVAADALRERVATTATVSAVTVAFASSRGGSRNARKPARTKSCSSSLS